MSNKIWYAYDIQYKLKYDDKKFKRLLVRIKDRHPHEYWFRTRYAQNGQTHLMLDDECKRWLEEVYFNKSKYYLDLEIDFFEKRIRELEEELKIPHKEKSYNDMTIFEIMDEFDKTRNSVDVAIHKMIKVLGTDVKYKKDGFVVIKDYGVKWLYEKYYRKEYLKELEKYKLRLDLLS